MKLKQKLTTGLLAVLLLLTMVPATKAEAATYRSAWDTATEGQRNIVRRAYQMTDIQWTPVTDVTGWKEKFTYKAGTTYTGLPYSQPLKGKYVPWKASYEDFMAAVADPSSSLYQLYKDSQNGNIIMPYYGTDCSGFVGWAWGVTSRGPTTSLPTYGTLIGSGGDYSLAQIGDGLIAVGDHATIITDITYDASGNVNSIEVSDSNTGASTNYCCRKIRYGAGGTKTMSDYKSKFGSSSKYKIYRRNNYENITYTHSCAVPLPDDSCAKCGLNYYKETACNLTGTVSGSASAYSVPSTTEGAILAVLFPGSTVTIKAYHVDDTGAVWYKTTEDTWIPGSRVSTNCSHSYTVTVTQEPDCTTTGTGTYTCKTCMYRYVGDVAKLGHSYQNGQCIRCELAYDPSNYQLGDLDTDGIVSTEDAVLLLLHVLFGEVQYPVANAASLDLDGNGSTNTEDAVYLLLHVLFGQSQYPIG